MARHYARLAADIWKNEDFRKLPAQAQRLYLVLISQPDISAAGVLPMTIKRWASYAPDTSEADVRTAIDSLSDSLFVVVDYDTEELLVRTFAKWDGGSKNPKRVPSILDAYRMATSYPIDRALTRELSALGVLPQDQRDSLSDRVSDTHRVVVKEAVTTSNPQPATRNPEETSSPRPRKRGSRIPDDFAVTAEMVTWAQETAPHVDGKRETEKFVNHWLGESGAAATKLDWTAAWRKWILIAADRQGPRTNGKPQQIVDENSWMRNR